MQCCTEFFAVPVNEFSFVLNSFHLCHWDPNLSYYLVGVQSNSTDILLY
jgi:hypothetical protein